MQHDEVVAAAAQIMLTEGPIAVTSRRLAETLKVTEAAIPAPWWLRPTGS